MDYDATLCSILSVGPIYGAWCRLVTIGAKSVIELVFIRDGPPLHFFFRFIFLRLVRALRAGLAAVGKGERGRRGE